MSSHFLTIIISVVHFFNYSHNYTREELNMVQRIVLVLQKSILRISAKRNQKYPIEDLIILSNNNGNRMVRLLVTAVVIPEES
jgi:hypothetical protein